MFPARSNGNSSDLCWEDFFEAWTVISETQSFNSFIQVLSSSLHLLHVVVVVVIVAVVICSQTVTSGTIAIARQVQKSFGIKINTVIMIRERTNERTNEKQTKEAGTRLSKKVDLIIGRHQEPNHDVAWTKQ